MFRHIRAIGFDRRNNPRQRAESNQSRGRPKHDRVEFQRIQHDAGLRANDARGDRHDATKTQNPPPCPGRKWPPPPAGWRQKWPPPRAQRAENGDFPAALVHRIVNARQNGSRGDQGHEIGNQRQHAVEPADLVEQIGHHLANGPRKSQPVALLVVHHVQPETGDGAAGLQFHQHRADFRGGVAGRGRSFSGCLPAESRSPGRRACWKVSGCRPRRKFPRAGLSRCKSGRDNG